MLELLKRFANQTYTENGAVTPETTLSDNLDLFATIGALRQASEDEIALRFSRAFAEDPRLAMKNLFYARDVRGGLGERRVFRAILRWLAENAPDALRTNAPLISEYGRWDDLLALLGTRAEDVALEAIRSQFTADMQALAHDGAVSLLAKWLPSPNASSAAAVADAKRVARALGLREVDYRKALTALRARIRILENHLRQRDYTFDYARQPSRAMLKYRKAFNRNDGARYQAFLRDVSEGRAKLHTGTLAPYDIIAPVLRRMPDTAERRALDVTWNAQPDYTNGENALVVVDGSGSMYWASEPPVPAAVALSLGIYFAERNTGAFHNHFITFSRKPRLVEVKGSDIAEKVRYAMTFNEVANTNLQAVFDLILRVAVALRLPQKELPDKLYIISDMEFDMAVQDASLSNFEAAKRAYATHGYRLPEVVFWNVNSRNRQQPVTMNEQGVALVSGASARTFEMLAGGILSPMAFMLSVLESERYAAVGL